MRATTLVATAAWFAAAALVLETPPASAQVEVQRLASAVQGLAPRPKAGVLDQTVVHNAIVLAGSAADLRASDVSRVSRSYGVVRGTLAELAQRANAHPDWTFTWSAPLRPLLDQAGVLTGATPFLNRTGATGRGTLIGIVDTGVDLHHPDLRNPDGSTRVAWLLDFSRSPTGVHPQAESQCNEAGLSCAVLSAADIDARLSDPSGGRLPTDRVGHGTHVASLAAGRGATDSPYVGVAPEAELVIARVTQSTAIADADVLKAVQLIFWLADEHRTAQGLERMPAVVNLSLGSDFGPHDGSSPLSQALGEMVGEEFPGRALVVAGGNSAALVAGTTTLPEPLGIHTEVHVPVRSSVRVPVATPVPRFGSGRTQASVYIWIGLRDGDELAVGLDRADGPWIPPNPRGTARQFQDGELSVTCVNGVGSELGLLAGDSNAAVVVLEGEWPAGETFAVRLEGHGTANLWVQSEGDLGPATGSVGALFPAATKEGTVTIPAAHPELISVGATLNRTSWQDRSGETHVVRSLGGISNPAADTLAFFSSFGPTAHGNMKPDLVAPGAFVIGAMSADADPEVSPLSVFAQGIGCSPSAQCSVVDDTHALTSGTSMAAPLVSGAIALLFERAPQLTQPEVRALLQAGARRLDAVAGSTPQMGAGALNIEGAFDVLDEENAPSDRRPDPARSWLTLSSGYARPDPRWGLEGFVQLRDGDGRVADGIAPDALQMAVGHGALLGSLQRVAPGLWRFAVAADAGSGGAEMTIAVSLEGRVLVEERWPIAVDVNVARYGLSGRGGCDCQTAGGAPVRWPTAGLLIALGLGVLCRNGARRARNPDRTGR